MSTITLHPVARPVARSAARPRKASPAPVRLTRRGRIVMFTLGLLIAFGAGLVLASGSIATSADGGQPKVEIVTVAPGDTLWGIASAAAAEVGSTDVRGMIERIDELNALDSSMVFAGQDLRVPTE